MLNMTEEKSVSDLYVKNDTLSARINLHNKE